MTAPSPTPRTAVTVLGAALGLGVLADLLLRTQPWGASLAVWIGALVGTGAVLARRFRVSVAPEAPWLAFLAPLLAVEWARRDAPELRALVLLALLCVLGVLAWSGRGAVPRTQGLAAWIRGLIDAARGTAVGLLPLALSDINWSDPDRSRPLRLAPAIAAGVLLAALPLIVFGALFSAADAVFDAALNRILQPEILLPHVVWTLAGTAITAGFLRHALLTGRDPGYMERPGPTAFVPIVTALALVNALFLLFVVVQVRYLFGGAALVQATVGLSYAEYARRGFFELVAASGLVLPLLAGAEWAVRAETAARRAAFRHLATLLMVLVAVIVVSALERMCLYVAAFGLTNSRIYATAGEVFLLGVFAWFARTTLRGRHRQFPFGAAVIGLAVLGGLLMLNPDAFAIRWNLARPGRERPFDAKYAATLGADAAPLLAAAIPRLPAADRCVIVARLREWNRGEPDWRTWNLARARAQRIAREQAAAFDALCPEPPPPTSGG
jgi:hypothetical protein